MANEKTEIHFDSGEPIIVKGDTASVVAKLETEGAVHLTLASGEDVAINGNHVKYVKAVAANASAVHAPTGTHSQSRWKKMG